MATRREQVQQARQELAQQKVLIEAMDSPSHYREVAASSGESRADESELPVSAVGREPLVQVDEVARPSLLVPESRSLEMLSSSAIQAMPTLEQLREAAHEFDRWHAARVQLGARVLLKSKQRLARFQKSLRLRSMGAAIDFLLAEAEVRLLGRAS